jgi:transcriptional regulator with XRE-family HTH domain
MNIGKLIHDKRIEADLTLEQVGEACGVSKATVQRWETGAIRNMRRNKIVLLARVLMIDPVDLVVEQNTTVIPFDGLPAPETITTEERMLVQAYREATTEARTIAMETLSNHKKEEFKK